MIHHILERQLKKLGIDGLSMPAAGETSPAGESATEPAPELRLPASGVRLDPELLKLGPAAVGRILGIFLENLAELTAAIESAVEAQNAAALQQAAHSLKGSSGTIGAARMAALCQRLEALAEQGSMKGAAVGLEELKCEHGLLRESLGPSLVKDRR